MEPHPGDIGSIILETLEDLAYRGSLILETEGASSWTHREPHPGDIGILILET